MELLGHTSYIKGSSQVRNVLVNIYAPRYQNVQTFMVTCQHKEKTALFSIDALPFEHVPPLLFPTEVAFAERQIGVCTSGNIFPS